MNVKEQRMNSFKIVKKILTAPFALLILVFYIATLPLWAIFIMLLYAEDWSELLEYLLLPITATFIRWRY